MMRAQKKIVVAAVALATLALFFLPFLAGAQVLPYPHSFGGKILAVGVCVAPPALGFIHVIARKPPLPVPLGFYFWPPLALRIFGPPIIPGTNVIGSTLGLAGGCGALLYATLPGFGFFPVVVPALVKFNIVNWIPGEGTSLIPTPF